MKPFSQWTIEEVEETFGVKQESDNPSAQHWLQNPVIFSKHEQTQLEALRGKLVEHVYNWNEQELIVYFIWGNC